MVSVLCGQLAGTAVGNSIYADRGWVASGSASVGFVALALVICLVRGPHEPGWIGWHGGYDMRKRVPAKPKNSQGDQEDVQVSEQSTPFDEEKSEEFKGLEKEVAVNPSSGMPERDQSSQSSQRTLGEEIQEQREKS